MSHSTAKYGHFMETLLTILLMRSQCVQVPSLHAGSGLQTRLIDSPIDIVLEKPQACMQSRNYLHRNSANNIDNITIITTAKCRNTIKLVT